MKHKPTFLHQNKPLNTCMIQAKTAERAAILIRNAAWDGADAIGLQIEKLEKQDEATIRQLFSLAGKRPIYFTHYRHSANDGKTDDQLGDELVKFVEWGGTLADVMGDYYCRTPYELTSDAAAIEKQKALIGRIHAAGGEVLMSSHVLQFRTGEEVLAIAKEHQARGADISKIVTSASTEEEQIEALRTVSLLKKELDIPFLFLCGGNYTNLLRTVGPMLGCAMWLTVAEQDELSTRAQPLCRAIRAIADNYDFG